MTLDWPRSPSVIGLSGVLLLVLTGSGCATALSTGQSAEALPKGKWHVGVGTDVNVSVSRIVDALDAAESVEENIRNQGPDYKPTEDEKRQYTDAAIGLALSMPGVATDVMVRYGLGRRFDVGARWTTTGLHADVKYQFLGGFADDGWHGALSLGYGYHSFEGIVFDVLEFLQVDDFSRHDIEVPLIFGKRFGDFGRFWFGPKFIAAKVHVDAQLERFDATLQTDDWIYYYGGFAGVAGGYKGLEAFAELTVVDMIAKPVILDEKRDLGGIVVMPMVGVMARF
jgi:hypothetical protein